jgi:hypothetical protein
MSPVEGDHVSAEKTTSSGRVEAPPVEPADNIMTQSGTERAKAERKVIFSGFAVCFLSALCFTLIGRTWQTFLSCGIAAVVINLTICLSYSFSKRASDSNNDGESGRLVLVTAGMTLLIPFATLYTLFAWLLAGFPLSF